MIESEHGELLMELVQSPYWRAVKEEIRAIEGLVQNLLLTPPKDLMAVLQREGHIASLRVLRLVVDTVEAKAANHMKRQSEGNN